MEKIWLHRRYYSLFTAAYFPVSFFESYMTIAIK